MVSQSAGFHGSRPHPDAAGGEGGGVEEVAALEDGNGGRRLGRRPSGGAAQVDLTVTIIVFTACALLLAVAVVLDRRPYRPGKLNYIPLMILCLAACLVLGRHLMSLIW
jgi:hypothetical protein